MADRKISALSAVLALGTDVFPIARSGANYKVLVDDLAYYINSTSKAVRRNALIGGSAGTNPWQAGTSFVSPGTGTYTADMWLLINSGAGLVTVSKSADAPTVAQAGKLLTHCFLLDVTTADTTLSAGDLMSHQTRIEGYVWRQYAQRACAIKFWHRHSKTGAHCVALRNSGTDRSLVMEYTQVVADAWEEATLDLPASPSAGTWDYTTGIGLYVDFPLVAGSTFHTTAGAWQTGNFYATAGAVNNLDNVANNFRIEDVRLLLGDEMNGGEIENRSAAKEFALCQRYLPAFIATGAADGIGVGAMSSTTNCQAALTLPQRARVTPTGIVVSAAADFTMAAGGASFVASAAAIGGTCSPTLGVVNFTVAGATVGQAALVRFNVATGKLLFTGCQL